MISAYCINLKRRGDRWNIIQARAAAIRLPLMRIEAVDATLPENAVALAALPKRGPVGTIGIGARACTLSHKLAWQTFLEGDQPFGVFLEDDAMFSDDFVTVCEQIIRSSNGFDLIKLEGGGSARRGAVTGPVIETFGKRRLRQCFQIATNSAGYIMSREGARQALARVDRCDVGLDHFLFYPRDRIGNAGLPYALVEPSIVIQDNASESNINDARFENGDWSKDIRRGFYEALQLPAMIRGFLKGARLIAYKFEQ